jgi:hypothetical protein
LWWVFSLELPTLLTEALDGSGGLTELINILLRHGHGTVPATTTAVRMMEGRMGVMGLSMVGVGG